LPESQIESQAQNQPETTTTPHSASLKAVLFCQPQAKRFSGESLKQSLPLPDFLASSRALGETELKENLVSSYLRTNDLPLAFHRETTSTDTVVKSYAGSLTELEELGRCLQYVFSDGLILTGSQVLYHDFSRHVPRHLLPLTVNVHVDLRDRTRHPARYSQTNSWKEEAENVMISVLLAAARALKQAAILRSHGGELDEDDEPVQIYFAHESKVTEDREVLRLETVELSGEGWGPWHLNTALLTHLTEPAAVHYGRARLELDPQEIGEHQGLAERFALNLAKRKIIFHSFSDQLRRLRHQAPASTGAEVQGLSLHLSGHSLIQATVSEINDLWNAEGRTLKVDPASQLLEAANVKPRLNLTGDGSFRMSFTLELPDGKWEAHGLPQSCAYILLNLQHGLAATTGYSNTQIAHTRRGLKRERDMKILRSLGYAALIFHDAGQFALGLPLSDGVVVNTQDELCESLFTRLGALILKSEGWPVQSGSLRELCSKNVTTLIEGFVSQVVNDLRGGREISVYLPSGEWRVQGIARAVTLFFHALVGDLASQTAGSCFGKARTKYFENFMNGRPNPEKEDLALRHSVDAETAARLVYQPGVNERYLLPESSIAPRGAGVLGLLTQGFDLTIDGKEIEEFEAADFRPEFTLVEDAAMEAVATGGHKIDWFELHPKFFFKGTEISSDQASRLSREGMLEFQGKLYRIKAADLPSFNRLNRFWASIQSKGAGLMHQNKRRRTEETYYQLPRSQTLELLALRASGVKMRGGERWDEICRFYDSLDKERPPLEMPASFHAQLQNYQFIGVQWILDLYQLGLGGILADDMGLGKTVTSLAFLESLRSRGKLGPCLVLVPTSLTYNWFSEAARFAPEMPIRIFQSKETEEMLDFVQGGADGLVVCTYGLLQENSELLQQIAWNCIIFDEAQNLKTITTKRTTAARKLQAQFKLCLSGTPLENHYGELYSLFDLIVPGSLGDLSMFRERYVNPPRVLKEEIDDLRLKVKPLLLRRTKGQVMNQLPPKVEQTVKLPFDEEQKKIYRDIASSYNEQVRSQIATQGEAKSQLQMLTALLRLRQVCSDPSSVPGVKYEGEPPKILTLVEALSEIVEGGSSALVFTQFLATYERIRAALTNANIRHYDMSGSDSRLSREKKLRGFQEDDGGAVMLMTLKTGGVGLNLVKASYIFHIEPWWNPAVENQATDRAHRIGQTKTVQVFRYLIKDSVEEKIEILKDIKSKRFDALFTESEAAAELKPSGSSGLSQTDFEYLLS
jgi:superfamily II DNA or RNA helicase